MAADPSNRTVGMRRVGSMRSGFRPYTCDETFDRVQRVDEV